MLTRFLFSGKKEKTLFSLTQKIVILNIIYYPEKKDVTIVQLDLG